MVVSQVRNIYVSEDKRLKQYKHFVWDMIEFFDAFGIIWKDRNCNKMIDLLANISIKPNDIKFASLSKVKVQTKPSIPHNV